MSEDFWGRIIYGVLAVCATVAMVVGEIVAVTDWIPHTAHSTYGYVALYAFFVAASAGLWFLIGGLIWLVVTDG